jgi:hypothetical protein
MAAIDDRPAGGLFSLMVRATRQSRQQQRPYSAALVCADCEKSRA